MTEPLLKAIYQDWPTCPSIVFDLEGDHVPGSGKLEDLGESGCLRLCREASHRMLRDLNLQDGDLPLPFIADHCWERWTECVRKPSAELHLPFIFLDKEGEQEAVSARLIFQLIRNQACSGSLYPAREMQGVQTDAEWDGAIEAALYHATQNGFAIPENSDLRWRVELVNSGLPDEMTGRSAGVTFLLALFHFFGKVAEWNTRQAFESIIALAALPTLDQTAQALIHLGGDESKKALALHDLGHHSGSQHLHVILAGSFTGFQNVELPPSVKITHAETVAQLKSAIQEIIRRERMSALEKPQALDFETYIQQKRKGFVGREWIFKKIIDQRKTGIPRILLISGDPGTGKTSLAAELVKRDSSIIAHHFCQASDADTMTAGNFVRSLAAMLAENLPDYKERLQEDDDLLNVLKEKADSLPGTAFNRAILKPLHSVRKPRKNKRKCIVIDAINEAEEDLLDLLKEDRLCHLPDWIDVVLTSTPMSRLLKSQFSGIRRLDLGEATAENRLDIQAFLKQRVNESEQSEKLKEILLEKSSGNFLYAAQALKGIENGIYSLDRLEQDLPPGLNGLYEAYFRNAFGAGESSLYRQINPLLELLCCAHEPLTIAEIEAALGLTKIQRAKMIESVSQFLGNRSRSNGEETITLYHLSISDWLTSSDDYGHQYLISSAEGQKRLAQYCRAAIAGSTKRLSWYVRRHAVTHLIEDHDWHSAGELLCDIEYLNGRAQLHELAFVRADFFELSKALSGLSEKDTKFQDLLIKIRSCQAFVANHMQALQKHSHRTHFFCQHAYLLSHQFGSLGDCGNPVVEAGHSILRDITEPKAIRYFTWVASRHHSSDSDQKQLRLTNTLTDLTLQHRHDLFSLNRAGLSPRDLDESMSRVAMSQGGFKCAYSPFIEDERHHHTWGSSRRASLEVHEGSALTLLQTEPNTIRNVSPSELDMGAIYDLSISDCGRYLFFISLGDMTPVRFDTETSSRTSLVPGRASRLAMSSAVDRAAILGQDSIEIWSLSNQTVIQEMALEFSHPFYTFAFSSDGNRFVTSDDLKLTIWDVDSGLKIHELFGTRGRFRHASLSSKGELLASAGVDSVLRIWSLSGALIAELHGHEGAIRSVYMSGDGTLIYSWGMDSTIRIWRVEDQKCLLLLYLPGVCRFSARTDDGLIAVGFTNGDVDLLQLQNLSGA